LYSVVKRWKTRALCNFQKKKVGVHKLSAFLGACVFGFQLQPLSGASGLDAGCRDTDRIMRRARSGLSSHATAAATPPSLQCVRLDHRAEKGAL